MAATGGLTLRYAGLRIASRNPRNPIVLSILTDVIAWALPPAANRRAALDDEWRAIAADVVRGLTITKEIGRRLVPIAAAAVAAGVVFVAISRGAFVAGGSDSYAYLSQLRPWAERSLRVEQPLMRQFDWPSMPYVFTPPGYAASGASTIVPGTSRFSIRPISNSPRVESPW